MKKPLYLLVYALLGASLLSLTTGCGETSVAGGTETQNPQTVACVKKLAQAAFDAADAGDAWRPDRYLEDSTPAALSRKLPKRLIAPAADTSVYVISDSRPDTMNLNGNPAIIRDTSYVLVKVLKPCSLFVNKTLLVADTLADTVRAGGAGNARMSVTTRAVLDSILVKDTVVLYDTLTRYYKRVIVSVQNAEKDAVQTTVQTDTTLTDLGILSDSANNPVAGSNVKEVLWVAPTRQIGDIAYSPATASVSYPIINSATKDTVVRTLGSSATNVRNNQLFISSSTFDGSILVETVRFDALDSLLSINRFNPSAFDTVESLTIHYSINPGAYAYSGADDRLLGTDRSYAYRFGRILHLSVSLTPTAADSSRQSYSGMIAGKLSLSGNEFGEFSGTIDTGMGLYGVLELNGKKYQVNCDHRYTTTIVEMTH